MEKQELTVSAFEGLIAQMYKQHRKVKAMQDELDTETKVLTDLKNQVLLCMEELDKDKYASDMGTVSVQNKFSVQVPKDEEKKQAFFAWLRDKEIFESTITVHSATLNSLYNSMLQESGDPDFEIPGIGKGTHYKTLSIRSK